MNHAVVQELLSFSDDAAFMQKGLDRASLHLNNPASLCTASPRQGISIYNRVNHEGFGMFHDRSVIPLNLPVLESKKIDAELK